MNLAPAILAALRGASEPLSNIGIREQIAELGDVPAIDAQHLVADALNKLVQADQVERVWDAGRCTYAIAPNAPPMDVVGADPGIEVGATRHSGDPWPVFEPAAVASPTPAIEAATVMPKPTSDTELKIEQKILAALAAGPLSSRELSDALPRVDDGVRRKHLKQLCSDGRVVAYGSTSSRRYALHGVDRTPQPKAASPKPAKSAPPAAQEPSIASTPSPVVVANAVPMAHMPIAELRTAASEILLSHGADPLPRALHRLVITALGAPKSLVA